MRCKILLTAHLYARIKKQNPVKGGLPSFFSMGKISVNRGGQPEAAGNSENLTCGVGGSIAGKVAYGFRHFFRLAHAFQRNLPQKQVLKFVG